MITYGLCGHSLKHSYSKIIHNTLGNKQYELINLARDEFYELMESRAFYAVNVTIPYKKDAYNACSYLSDEAKNIGSVNTVVNRDGVLCGYNTDFSGFVYMLERARIDITDKNVIILGTGGTSLTAQAVCRAKGVRTLNVVSRTGVVNYENVYDLADTQIVINTTPVGMYPDNGRTPVDISRFPKLSGVVDVIYNPLKTKILSDAQNLGIPYTGGLPMLVYQAARAHELFFDVQLDDKVVDRVLSVCLEQCANVVLVGMPGCGKTSIGKAVSNELSRIFLDTDSFVEQAGLTIPEIFEKYGEGGFRERETEAIKMLCSLSGRVIATGGGAVLSENNRTLMHQNGFVVYIRRKLENLATDGRPLSSGGLEKVKKLYDERHEIYESTADIIVDTNENVDECARMIVEKFRENVTILCPKGEEQ